MPTKVSSDEIVGRLRGPGHAYIVARAVWPGEGAAESPYFEVSISGPKANARQDVHRHGRPVLEVYVPLDGRIVYSYRECGDRSMRWMSGECGEGEAVAFHPNEVHYVQYAGRCVVVKAPHTGDTFDKQVSPWEIIDARAACYRRR